MRTTATLLNLRSGPGTQFRVLDQLRNGTLVDPMESSGDWLWVEGQKVAGWVHKAYVAPSHPSTPTGLIEIARTFGSPGGPQCSAGRARLPRPLQLSWSRAEITQFACHIDLEDLFTEVFQAILLGGLWPELENFGGCYNDRPIRAGGKRSTHAWGIAVDLNTTSNAQGTTGSMHPGVVETFETFGFQWGGAWLGASRDPMHFQFAFGY